MLQNSEKDANNSVFNELINAVYCLPFSVLSLPYAITLLLAAVLMNPSKGQTE
jgi:hypothetical protein